MFSVCVSVCKMLYVLRGQICATEVGKSTLSSYLWFWPYLNWVASVNIMCKINETSSHENKIMDANVILCFKIIYIFLLRHDQIMSDNKGQLCNIMCYTDGELTATKLPCAVVQRKYALVLQLFRNLILFTDFEVVLCLIFCDISERHVPRKPNVSGLMLCSIFDLCQQIIALCRACARISFHPVSIFS
jgi:hypothetical protein